VAALEKSAQEARWKMLHQLSREDAPERRRVTIRHEVDHVAHLGREPALPAPPDHLGVSVDSQAVDTRFPQQIEKLAAAASEVEHGCGAAEVGNVVGELPPDLLRASAEPLFERHVARLFEPLSRARSSPGPSRELRPRERESRAHSLEPLLGIPDPETHRLHALVH
jgi:hypothetical protein